MKQSETTKQLFTIIDRLLDLLMVQSSACVLENESPEEDPPLDAVAGYALDSTPWTIEDETVRDPDPPNTDDPTEEE